MIRESLFNTNLPSVALFWFKVGITRTRPEQVIQGWPSESCPILGMPLQTLLLEVRHPKPVCHGAIISSTVIPPYPCQNLDGCPKSLLFLQINGMIGEVFTEVPLIDPLLMLPLITKGQLIPIVGMDI